MNALLLAAMLPAVALLLAFVLVLLAALALFPGFDPEDESEA